jgi:hypothetical protein
MPLSVESSNTMCMQNEKQQIPDIPYLPSIESGDRFFLPIPNSVFEVTRRNNNSEKHATQKPFILIPKPIRRFCKLSSHSLTPVEENKVMTYHTQSLDPIEVNTSLRIQRDIISGISKNDVNPAPILNLKKRQRSKEDSELADAEFSQSSGYDCRSQCLPFLELF